MITIRHEKPDDIPHIRHVNEQAFGRPAEANLVEALRVRGKAAVSLVAVQDGQVVGHILFSPVLIGSGENEFSAAGLAPMAVLPEFQRQSIGSLLVRGGLDECRKAGYGCIVVLGHPEYYPRFGFVPASRYGLKCEYRVPDEAFMAIELRVGALQGRYGTVRYQPEFDNV